MADEDRIEEGRLDDLEEGEQAKACAVDGCESDATSSVTGWAAEPRAIRGDEEPVWVVVPLCDEHKAEYDRVGDRLFAANHRLKQR